MTKSNKARVQKHRANLKAQGCTRIDVTIGGLTVDRARELARQTQREFWEVVEAALAAYVATGHPAETGNPK